MSDNLSAYPNLNGGYNISLLEVINFLTDSWKKLIIAALVGAILGLIGWFFLGSYSAEYVLLNSANTKTNTNTYGLDLLTWKIIQKGLPNLAAQIVERGKVSDSQIGIYRTLSSDQWWQKNATPIYALSKADSKDLTGIGKEFDGASTAILSITVRADGPSKEDAINAVRAAAQFLRSGGAYLQIRGLLNAYEGEVISATGEIQRIITSTQIEMGYQQQRVKFLEELYKRYPNNSSATQQVIDSKESGAKYLSIITQIIAAKNDINQSKEVLSRMDDRLAQLVLTKLFLDEALTKIEVTFDGLVLDKELLSIEANLREKISKADPSQREVLDRIRSQLLEIQARFTKGLDGNVSLAISSKKGIIKSVAGGFAGGFFLALLLLLGQRIWPSAKNGGAW
jgi:hypothetical protein